MGIIARIFGNIFSVYGIALCIYIPYTDVVKFVDEFLFFNLIFRLLVGCIPGYLFLLAGYGLIRVWKSESDENSKMNFIERKIYDLFGFLSPGSVLGYSIGASVVLHMATPIVFLIIWLFEIGWGIIDFIIR